MVAVVSYSHLRIVDSHVDCEHCDYAQAEEYIARYSTRHGNDVT